MNHSGYFLEDGIMVDTSSTIAALTLYNAIISKNTPEIIGITEYFGSNVKYAFDVLIDAELSYNQHFIIYESLIMNYSNAIKLAMAFVIMHKAGFSYFEHEELYKILIGKPKQSDSIAGSFARLAEVKMPYQGHQALYHILARDGFFSAQLAKIFSKLYRSNIAYQENKKLYHFLMAPSFPSLLSTMMVDVFCMLHNLNIFYKDHAELYDTIINKRIFSEQAIKIIRECVSTISPTHPHKNIYDVVFVKLIIYQKYYECNSETIVRAISNLVHSWTIEEIERYSSFSAEDYLEHQFCKHVQKKMLGFFLEVNDFDIFVKFIKPFSVSNDDNLVGALRFLKESGVSFEHNEVLYYALLKNSFHSLGLAKVFYKMHKNGMLYQDNKEVYKFLLTDSIAAELVSNAFVKLKKNKIYHHENNELYDFVGKKICNIRYYSYDYVGSISRANRLVTNLMHLMAYIPFDGYKAFYVTIEEKGALYDYKLIDFFRELDNENIPFHEESFLTALSKNLSDDLFGSISFILKIGIDFQSFSKYQSIPFLINNVEVGATILKKIISSGYSLKWHGPVFDKILDALCETQLNRVALFSTSDFLCDYAKKNRIKKMNNTKTSFLVDKIDNILSSWKMIVEGPLNKSTGTIEIEGIISKICDSLGGVGVKLDRAGNFSISFSGDEEINLSLLIRNSNLSHLLIENKQLNRLNFILNDLIDVQIDCRFEKSWVLTLLSEVEQKAFSIYFADFFYKNINKFFRGESLSKKPEVLLNTQEEKNWLAYFLVGCIINNAVNKITCLVHELPIKKIIDKLSYRHGIFLSEYNCNSKEFNACLNEIDEKGLLTKEELDEIRLHKDKIQFLYSDFDSLDRGEILSETAITKRTSNIWSLPALTSFSAFKKGVSFFHNKKTIRTQLENVSNYYIVNHSEKEVIFSQGEQFKTIRTINGELISRIIRSPLFERKNHYLSELALVDAFEYLSKEYNEEKSAITINKKVIYRPNHNVTHTYRVMLSIEQVIYYFSNHAKESDFKNFCQSIHPREVEWLRVAAAFSITGRESELSAKDDLKKYEQYRAECARHFNLFLYKFSKNIQISKKMRDRIAHVIRYMGNPGYEQSLGDKMAINNIQDIEERKIRNFYHRILSIAHKIDLLRCYSAREYKKSIRPCLSLSEGGKFQMQAFNEMIHYNLELLKIHGSNLTCALSEKGVFQNVYVPYKKTYAKSSTSLKHLFERSELVPLNPAKTGVATFNNI